MYERLMEGLTAACHHIREYGESQERKAVVESIPTKEYTAFERKIAHDKELKADAETNQ